MTRHSRPGRAHGKGYGRPDDGRLGLGLVGDDGLRQHGGESKVQDKEGEWLDFHNGGLVVIMPLPTPPASRISASMRFSGPA